MAETKVYKNVRFANRIDTESNWVMINPTLEPGELAFVGEEGNYFMILGDTHRRPIKEIIDNPSAHASHVFYPASRTGDNGGGGGGGGSTTIPVASATILGGVKVPEEKVSGLTIATDGTLKNALVSRYDYDRGCFVVNKLYIKDLEYDNKVTNPSFEGDFLTLRAESTSALDVKSGIIIKSLQEGFDGFLGLSAENKIIVAQTDGTYSELVGIASTGVGIGLVNYASSNNYATITECSTLTLRTNTGDVAYNPSTPAVDVDVTSPPISVNGQVFNYNTDNNRYDIELEGGLTEENRQKLEQLSQSLEDIATLQKETLTEVKSGNKITVTDNNDRTVTVNHDTTALQDDNISAAIYTVKSQTPQTEKIKVLVDIETDVYGHVIKKHFKEISWVIQ